MENPLAAFLYALLILCLLRALSQPSRRSVMGDMGIGMLLGCLILARLLPASLLAVATMLLVTGVCLPRRSSLTIVAAMLVALGIWGMYAKISFGHILPTSFLVKSQGGLIASIRYWCTLAPADVYRSLTAYAAAVFRFLGDHGSGTRLEFLRKGGLAVGVMALCVCATFPSWWSRGRTLVAALAAMSLVGLFANPILLYSRQSELLYRKWYFFDITAILAIICGVSLGFLGQIAVGWLALRGVGPQPGAAAACIGLLCLGTVVAEARLFRNVRPLTTWEYSAFEWQHVAARSALWFRSEVRLADTDRVGALNAGIAGLLLGGKVVNLDGLANDDIVDHRQHGGTLAEYVSRERIRYIIDVLPPPTFGTPEDSGSG